MRLLIMLVVACAEMGLHPLAAVAHAQSVPQCLAGFCLDAEKLPTEKEVRARFGGSKQPALLKDFAYCYRFITPRPISYGHFMHRDFATGLRLAAIPLSKEPPCADAHAVRLKTPLSTKEGIRLNSHEAEVLKRYGQPRYALRPPPVEVVRDFFGASSKTTIDVIDQYVSSDDKDPSVARFYVSQGQVVGVEVSADE